MTPPLFYLKFGVFPLDQITNIGVSVSTHRKLFGRKIILEVFQVPTYVITVPERHRQTDTQTGRRHTVALPRSAWHSPVIMNGLQFWATQ